MTNDRRPTDTGNLDYQHQLASSLVRSLGLKGAIDACYQNCWSGTLSVILKK
jgi:hypothetical protein